jgi:hypothetical protein
MEGETPQAADFELEKYRTDRAHELELNKFTHTLEMERLKILQLLNGGAFTVVVGFSDALVAATPLSRGFAVIAILCWIVGLAGAAHAAQLALDLQRGFTQAYHNRRRAIEWRLLHGKYKDPRRLAAMIAPPPARTDAFYDAAFEAQADDYRAEAGRLGPQVKEWSRVGLILFTAGALSMTVALAAAGARPSPAAGPSGAGQVMGANPSPQTPPPQS